MSCYLISIHKHFAIPGQAVLAERAQTVSENGGDNRLCVKEEKTIHTNTEGRVEVKVTEDRFLQQLGRVGS